MVNGILIMVGYTVLAVAHYTGVVTYSRIKTIDDELLPILACCGSLIWPFMLCCVYPICVLVIGGHYLSDKIIETLKNGGWLT